MTVSGAQRAWSDAATWTDGTILREVFFFPSGHERLYGSFVSAVKPSRPFGLVLCGSWGIEAHRMSKLVAKLARKAADSGGAALMFHYPGFGDSTGRSESATVERMVEAARDAVVEASRRGPTLAWGLVGIRLGASIAALARRHAGVSTLLLVQPALDPTSYFDEVRWMARRANLGAEGISGYAFGYPIIHTVPSKLGDAVRNELSENPDGVVAVCYEHPAMNDPSLDQVDRITVAGRWQFGLKSYPELKEASVRGLQRVMGGRT